MTGKSKWICFRALRNVCMIAAELFRQEIAKIISEVFLVKDGLKKLHCCKDMSN